MRKIYYILTIILSTIASGCSNNPVSRIVVEIPSVKQAINIVSIDNSSTKLTTKEIDHYIRRVKADSIEWLFDGFLLLDSKITVNNIEYDYDLAFDSRVIPNKDKWEYLLSRNFGSKQSNINTLELTLDSLSLIGIDPPYKRHVIITLPNAQHGQTDWGEWEGKIMDFNLWNDRYIAACWYIEKVIEQWTIMNYHYIDLGGFYWIHQTIDTQLGDEELIRALQAYIHEKGYKFYWSPHYGAEGATEWQALKFDMAYQQVNYYGDPKLSLNILRNAIDTTKKYKMAICMEFDDKVGKPEYENQFYTYINEFEIANIWSNSSSILYNQGNNAWLDLSLNSDKSKKKMYNTLAAIITKRNKNIPL